MVTMSDIAYTVAVIENSYAAWDEEHEIDNAGERQEAYQRPQKTVKTKFTNRVGKKRQCNMSGWSADGIQFYNKVRDSWRALSQDQSDATWSMLEEEWAAYEDKGFPSNTPHLIHWRSHRPPHKFRVLLTTFFLTKKYVFFNLTRKECFL